MTNAAASPHAGDLPVLVAGAGLGGLTAALALLRRGIGVRVLEQAPALGEVGAGITLSPNATRVFVDLGLGDALHAIGTRPPTQGVVHFRTAEPLVVNERGDRPFARYGAHYYQAHRADVHALLAGAVAAADPAAIVLGARVVDVEDDGDEVRVRTADGATHRGRALVGADGVRSAVAAWAFGRDRPRFTGHVAWRGVVPIGALPGGLGLPFGSGLGIAPGQSFGWYRLRGDTCVNFVALSRREAWADEGWAIEADVAEVLAEFAAWHPAFRALPAALPGGRCHRWGLFDRPPRARWSAGRVTLLGDAAHAMLPFMGQGAAMAIEDGLVLARALAAYPVPEAFARYEAARRPRTADVQLESRAKGLRVEGEDTDRYDRNRHRNEESLGLFEYDAAAVPL